LSEHTEAYVRFQEDAALLLRFTAFFGELVTHSDEVGRILHEGREEPGEGGETDKGAVYYMREHVAPMLRRLLFEKGVDNFLSYISDVLGLIFETRPQALRSSETVKLNEILQHESMEQLIDFLVERKVERLAYQSLRDLGHDLETTLNFALFLDEDAFTTAASAVEIRNVLVHNRGKVNRKYFRNVTDTTYELGDAIEVSGDHLFSTLGSLETSAHDIDLRAIEKFGLPAVTFRMRSVSFATAQAKLTLGAASG